MNDVIRLADVGPDGAGRMEEAVIQQHAGKTEQCTWQ